MKIEKKIENISILKVECEKIRNVDCIIIDIDNNGFKYNNFTLSDPERIIIDISNSEFKEGLEEINVGSDKISKIRKGIQENDVSRVVIDLNEKSEYTILKEENKLYIALEKDFNLLEDVKTDDNLLSGDEKEEEIEVEEVDYTEISGIKYVATYDRIRVLMDGLPEVQDFKLEDPHRIVLDFKDTLLTTEGPTTISPQNNLITEIRVSQKESDVVRLVIELSEKVNYTIKKLDKEVQINIEEINYKNIEYIVEEENAKLILSNVKLSNLTRKQSTGTKTYTISYSSSKFSSGSGVINIKDDFVNKITITKAKITIKDKGKMRYYAKQDGDDVVITIKKENPNEMKTVLIDVGHGGNDPGACNGNAYEKVYNLKIALKLYDLLKETENIEVIMDRTSDVGLTTTERLDFVAEYDEADLLICIHNNSVADKSCSGTMVLYYNKETDADFGITSKQYAQNVLNELVDALEIQNRGVISRKDLFVLRETAVPAILCEVCFISNENDLAKLKTDKFQQLAAEAMYKGILDTLDSMK